MAHADSAKARPHVGSAGHANDAACNTRAWFSTGTP